MEMKSKYKKIKSALRKKSYISLKKSNILVILVKTKTLFHNIILEIKQKTVSCSLEKSILYLNTTTKNRIAILLLLNFVFGLILLFFAGVIQEFIIHLICLTLNIFVTLCIGKEYASVISFLDEKILFAIEEENIELRQNYKRFRKNAFNISNILFCFIVLLIFLWSIFSQHYIESGVIGYYAVYMVSITVSISVIGYAEYLWLLWFLYRVCNCTFIPYNKIIPAYTPFLVKIATLTNHAKWCFFIEGFLYVFEYYILIPPNSITMTGLNMPDNLSFLITWGVIFIVIILAFPIIIFIQETFLSKIVCNLKSQQIKTLSSIFNVVNEENYEQFNELNLRYQIINNLITTPDYPVHIQRIGPAIISAATFILHIFNLISQYPELKKLLVDRLLGIIM